MMIETAIVETVSPAVEEVLRSSVLNTPCLPAGVIAAQNLACKEWVSACFLNHRNNRLAWFDHYQIDPELVGRCRWADAGVVESALKYYGERLTHNPAHVINPNDIMKLIEREVEADKLIDAYLAQGASNSLMRELFRLSNLDLTARRMRIGVETKSGRRASCKLDESDRVKMIDIYTQEKAVGVDERRVLLSVSTISGVAIETVYHTLRRSKVKGVN